MTNPSPVTNTVERAARRLLDNINEFGTVTDGEFVDDLAAALNTRSHPSDDEIERVARAIGSAPSYLPGQTLDDELSAQELENAARAAIKAFGGE